MKTKKDNSYSQGRSRKEMIAHLKTCNKTFNSKTAYANEEMDKAKAFAQKAIEIKFVLFICSFFIKFNKI